MSSILVVGGYGVFGTQLARELANSGLRLTLAGRDRGKAERIASLFGASAKGVALDIRDPAACQAALPGHALVVNCAGPFSEQGPALLESCLQLGCHYVDIADDREYVSRVRSLHPRFQKEGLTAAYGCSSLPGISGALCLALPQGEAPPCEVRVTLFIGNRNPKGSGAVSSLFKILGTAIRAPQGMLCGFGDPERVQLPEPWGERQVYNFESPEYDLFPELLGVSHVRVKVGFELKAVNHGLSFLARLPKGAREVLQIPLGLFGNILNGWGSSGGAVQVERWDADGTVKRGTLYSWDDGQRMAILPAVAVVKALLQDWKPAWAGANTAYEMLGPRSLLNILVGEGFQLEIG